MIERSWRKVSSLIGVIAACAAQPALSAPMAGKCTADALNAMGIPGVTVIKAVSNPQAGDVPAHCDVTGDLATDGEGGGPNVAGFRLTLPANWNGRFLMNGSAGMAGFTSAARPEQLISGYAVVSGNAGHVADPRYPHPGLDGTWAIKSPGTRHESKVIDYLYRANHQVVVAGKRLTTRFYGGDAIKYSYFIGCSNGGREALIEGMKYPEDFDGIISGAPPMEFGNSMIGRLRSVKRFLADWIPYSAFPALESAVYEECDAKDGVKDGLIQNPAACAFDPRRLVPDVLTASQAAAVQDYLSATYDEAGRLIAAGMPASGIGDASQLAPGGAGAVSGIGVYEAQSPATHSGLQPWGELLKSPVAWMLSYGMLANLVYVDPGVDLLGDRVVNAKGVASSEAVAAVQARLGAGYASDATRYADFVRQGKKLLIYHGFNDSLLSAFDVRRFFERLADQSGGYAKLGESVRLFMVPDMQHCSGGPGPNTFDMHAALVDWVEKGKVPQQIVATKYAKDSRTAVERTMPLCPFPAQARYSGSGAVNEAANWSCPPGDQSLLQIGLNGGQAGLSRRP